MCQRRFISYNHCTTSYGMLMMGKVVHVQEKGIVKLKMLSSTAEISFISKLLLSQKCQPKDRSWSMECQPPAAWLGQKDNISVILEFVGVFIHQWAAGGRRRQSDKIYRSQIGKGWRKVKRGQIWDHRVHRKKDPLLWIS